MKNLFYKPNKNKYKVVSASGITRGNFRTITVAREFRDKWEKLTGEEHLIEHLEEEE